METGHREGEDKRNAYHLLLLVLLYFRNDGEGLYGCGLVELLLIYHWRKFNISKIIYQLNNKQKREKRCIYLNGSFLSWATQGAKEERGMLLVPTRTSLIGRLSNTSTSSAGINIGFSGSAADIFMFCF